MSSATLATFKDLEEQQTIRKLHEKLFPLLPSLQHFHYHNLHTFHLCIAALSAYSQLIAAHFHLYKSINTSKMMIDYTIKPGAFKITYYVDADVK